MATEKGKKVAVKSPPSANSTTGKRRKPSPEVEGGGGGVRRKKRQSGVLRFLDTDAVEAETDSDKEEETQPDGKDLDFVNHDKAETKYPNGCGKSYPLPFYMKQDDLSDDELEELIKERYGRDSKHVVYDEELKECEVDVTKGTPIWRVKCMIGRERHIAFCLMQKFVDLQKFGTKLEIFSVFSVEHVKGFVYFEADKACDVAEACKGIYDVYSSQVGLVPRNEVPHLLSVRNKVCEASKDAWVRIKSGKYKGDLGRIVAVDEARKRATIKLVPRLDLQAIAQKFGGGISLKRAAVPPPRLITSRELEDFRTLVQTRRDRQTGEIFEVLDGMMLKDGYLYKKVSVASLVYWGVEPSDAELLKFMEMGKGDPDDFSWISSVYNGDEKLGCSEASAEEMPAKQGSGFNLYDLVLFGQKAFGVIVAIENDRFRILKGDMEVPEVATVKLQEIKNGCADKMFTACDRHMKSISISDTVKVLEGPHEGRKGIVRHMYKGALFIHDVSQAENGGYFCVQSKLCESVKESTGGRPSSMLPQSSTKSSEQTDTSRSFNQHHQGNRGQVFTIGETLRIRKGPLKGFLCRVMGVYRSDVTVKLDSLVKVITVPSDLLCPTKPMGDSWQTPTVARDIDKEADEKQATDHWRSKSAPEARDKQPGADNAWGNIATESKGESGWGTLKVSGGIQSDKWGKGNDNWGTLNVPGGSQTDKWGKVTDNDVVSAGGWTKTGPSCQNQTHGWNKRKSFDGDQLSSWSIANSGGVGVYKAKEAGVKPKETEDRALVRGRGKGGNSEDKGIINQGAWTNLMSCNAAREQGWGSEKHDTGEHEDKESSWNQQRDFDGGRGSRQKRGIGRGQCGARARGGDGGGRGSRVQYGARESRDEGGGSRASDWSNSGEGCGFGTGRRSGQNGDSDDIRSSARSRVRGRGSSARGRGRGRGHFCDEEQEADPLRSKPTYGARDQEPGSGDARGSKAVSGARDAVRGDNDAWGSKIPMAKGGSSFNTMKGQGEGPNNIWGNMKNATDAGWSKAGPFGQRQVYGTNQFSSWNKDTNNTGGRGLGQWIGRGGNFEDQGNNNRGLNKPIGRHGGRGQGGEEQDWGSETDIREKDSHFNPQRDFNGNQRSNRGGGRRGAKGSGDGNGGGRYGARGSGDGIGGGRFGARGSRGRFGAKGSRGRDGGGRSGGSGGRYGASGSKDENGGGRWSDWGNSDGGRGYENGRGRGRNENSGRERGRGRDRGRGQGRGPYDRPSRGGHQLYT